MKAISVRCASKMGADVTGKGVRFAVQSLILREAGSSVWPKLESVEKFMRGLSNPNTYYDFVQRLDGKHPDKTWAVEQNKSAVQIFEPESVQDAERLLKFAESWRPEDQKNL